MSSSLRFDGLAELRAQLRRLPEELAGEASGIVDRNAKDAAEGIRADYRRHLRTGRLEDGVIVTHVDAGKYAAGAIVKNTAKHAWLFENGSQSRHTDIGANRGSMPPGHVFIPRVVRQRRTMYEQLKAMLVRVGFEVDGNA